MAVYKCKMCGGDLTINEGSSVCECEYCGSMQTVPSVDDEKKMTLFNRANRLRFNCEFDKAAGVYESIVAEFPEEAEAYWGLVLCKYGIEYVDDPATAKKIPTCHRSSFDSVMDDKDFEMVMEYSDPVSRRVYREEAKQFEAIRKGIIEISGKEEPYDIFICYKETDENGQRTLDSVLAQDIYDALVGTGYRVFFSRITLEDKLGQEYEPYIFAALHSAKVMLAVGTDYEYYNAVWVKNEWSRYLKLITAGEKKTLIPCYKGIDAYDMPKEFERLQAQDLGKVGAMQDLLRGIEKIIGKKQDNKQFAQDMAYAAANPSIGSYLKRIQIFLEDSEWENAAKYCEKVLDVDPENGKAYVAALLASLKKTSIDQLKYEEEPLDVYPAYNKALRFASDDDKKRIEEVNQIIKNRIDEKKEAASIAKKEAEKARNENMKRARIMLGIEPAPEIAVKIEKEDERHAIELKRLNEELTARMLDEKPLLLSVEEEKKERYILEESRFVELLTPIEADKQSLEKELSALGIFSGKRKKEINTELNNLNKKALSIKNEYEARLAEFEVEAKSKYAEIHKEVEAVEQKIIEENNNYNGKIVALRASSQAGFGHYPKTIGGRPEPIEWELLEATDSAALVISKYALDCQKYNNIKINVTWETCDLRKWLNETFMQNAFNKEEQTKILTTRLTSDCKNDYNTNYGNDTNDKVFLLSNDEANKYFSSKESRQCTATSFANAKGAHLANNGNCMWWLRSPGASQKYAAFIDDFGNVYERGSLVDKSGFDYDGYGGAVRPALWINLG